MPIVVTGAGGFVGSALVRRMREQGLDCLPLSRGGATAKTAGGIQVEDYGDYIPSRGDTLIHLAQPRAIAETDGNQDRAAENTIDAAVALGRRLLAHDWGRVLFVSSAAVYGDGESHARRPDEELVPTAAYARMKMTCEQDVIKQGGTVLRLANVYGPDMASNNVLSDIMNALDKGGPLVVRDDTPVRDFIWVEDVAEGILSFLSSETLGIFNLGTAKGTSVRELAKSALQAAGQGDRAVLSSAPQDRQSCLVLDISLTTEATGWLPRVDVAEGLATLRRKNLKVDE
jgi:UDP-glucose 4-epimerase